MFKVYYTDPHTDTPHVYTVGELSSALYAAKTYRENGMTFVTMVSENPNSVGKAGVDEIINGACPDGVEYDWNKSSRIGATKRR